MSSDGIREGGSNSGKREKSVPSRRRFLRAVGVGGAAFVAGCSGGDGGDSTPTATEETDEQGTPGTNDTATTTETKQPGTLPAERTGQPLQSEFVLAPESKPVQDWDMNPFTQSTYSPGQPGLVHTLAPYGTFDENPDKAYKGVLMEENKLVDGKVWRQKIAEGFTWHDGREVTIDDRYNRVKYYFIRDKKLDREVVWDSVEKVDDRTMEMTLKQEQHPAIFHGTHKPKTQYPKSVFADALEAMQDAEGAREAFKTNEEYGDKSFPVEDWVGHGLWKISEVGENRVLYEIYEDFPEEHRKRQNIEQVKLPVTQGDTSVQLMIQNSEIDYHAGKGNVEDLPDDYRWVTKKGNKAYEWKLNHTNKHLDRRGVRRALQYLIDQTVMVEGPGRAGQYAIDVHDGVTPPIGNRWIPNFQERREQFIQYTGGRFPEKATEEVKREGYEQNSDGKWVGPDGDVLSFKINWGWWHEGTSTTIASFFKQFGIDATAEKYSGPFWADLKDYQKDWDIMPVFHSRGPNHPATAYGNQPNWGTQMWKFDDNDDPVPAGNRELETEIPTELGAKTLDGETREINIYDLQSQITDPASTMADLEEPTSTMQWWYNFDVPDLSMFGGYFAHLGDFANFGWRDWDGDGFKVYSNRSAVQWGLNTGNIYGKTK